jgi:DNA-binding response OmpR family regulator
MPSSTRRILHVAPRETDKGDLRQAIEKEGYAYSHLADVDTACGTLNDQPPDLVLVEQASRWALNYQSIERLKHANEVVPLIAIGADEEADELIALALGADDYVPHGSTKCLLARINAAVRRRSREAMASVRNAGPLQMDEGRYQATAGGRLMSLTPSEFRLLKELVVASGRVVRREDLHQRVFGISAEMETRRIDVHVASVRKKLGPASEWLQTVRSLGYAWRAPGPSETNALAAEGAN